jgi:hypothetical protein
MAFSPYKPTYGGDPPLLHEAGIYRPLRASQLRLIRLQDFQNGLLVCQLEHEERREGVGYSAISYVWDKSTSIWYQGADNEARPVIVNGTVVLVPEKPANILAYM